MPSRIRVGSGADGQGILDDAGPNQGVGHASPTPRTWVVRRSATSNGSGSPIPIGGVAKACAPPRNRRGVRNDATHHGGRLILERGLK